MGDLNNQSENNQNQNSNNQNSNNENSNNENWNDQNSQDANSQYRQSGFQQSSGQESQQPGYAQSGFQQSSGQESQQPGYPRSGFLQGSGQDNQQPGYPPSNLPQYQQSQYKGQSQYQQPRYPYEQPYQQYRQPGSLYGLAIASMICGIVSLCISCCAWFISFPAAVVGLILGIISIKKNTGYKGMAIAGIVTSSITILIAVLIIIGCTAFISSDFTNEWQASTNSI